MERKSLLFIMVLGLLMAASSVSYALGEEMSDALVSLSAGTGFIVHSDGYILTNEHVVRDASSISVFLNDAQIEYEGTVVVTDAANDLALIKIDCTRLPAVTLADSDDVSLFDPIVAMGYPSSLDLGTDLTTSTGQVTAVRTNMEGREGKETFQTDGAIYHGSSGGPLLNMSGEVIGVNYAGIEGAEFYFAIPIRDASQVFHSIPDFDPWQASDATETVSAQDIVDSVKPCIAYIQVEIERPLADLLPEEALGSALETWATGWFGVFPFNQLVTIDCRCSFERHPTVPLAYSRPSGFPGSRPQYWTPFCSIYEALGDAGIRHDQIDAAVERSSQAQFGRLTRTVSVSVFSFETADEAEAARRALKADYAGLLDSESHLLLSDSRLLSCGPLDFAVWWKFSGDDYPANLGAKAGDVVSITSAIKGLGFYSVGKLLFVIFLHEYDTDQIQLEKGWIFMSLFEEDGRLQDGRAVAETSIHTSFLVGASKYSYNYQSLWTTDDFIDSLNGLLETSIEALSE